MTLLEQDFDPTIVILSYAISFLGAYVAITASEELRQTIIDQKHASLFFRSDVENPTKEISMVSDMSTYTPVPKPTSALKYLLIIAVSVGGIGIWGMHFIGMQALRLRNHGEMVDMDYNLGLSLGSLFAVLVTTFLGVRVASDDIMFSKTKQEIVEAFINDTSKLSLAEIRKIDAKRILFIISTKNLGRLIFGGFITGSGVSVMHYIGMEAMLFPGKIEWSAGLVFFSVIIAIVASTVAFWIFFRLLSIFPEKDYLRLLSAFLMGVAVCGMHYVGMTAATYKYDVQAGKEKENHLRGVRLSQDDAFYGALVSANILLWILAMYFVGRTRHRAQELGKCIKKSDELANLIVQDMDPVALSSQISHTMSAHSAGNGKHRQNGRHNHSTNSAHISHSNHSVHRRNNTNNTSNNSETPPEHAPTSPNTHLRGMETLEEAVEDPAQQQQLLAGRVSPYQQDDSDEIEDGDGDHQNHKSSNHSHHSRQSHQSRQSKAREGVDQHMPLNAPLRASNTPPSSVHHGNNYSSGYGSNQVQNTTLVNSSNITPKLTQQQAQRIAVDYLAKRRAQLQMSVTMSPQQQDRQSVISIPEDSGVVRRCCGPGGMLGKWWSQSTSALYQSDGSHTLSSSVQNHNHTNKTSSEGNSFSFHRRQNAPTPNKVYAEGEP